jgi:multiple sugar transport system permease protein
MAKSKKGQKSKKAKADILQEEVEQSQPDVEQENVEQKVEADAQENIEQKVEADVQENVEQKIEADAQENVEQKVEADAQENVEQKVEADAQENVEQKVEADVQENIDQKIEVVAQENVEQKVEVDVQENTEQKVEADAKEQAVLRLLNKKRLGHEAKTNLWGYAFVAPFLLVFLLFNLWPTIYTFMLGFTDLKGLSQDFNFVGFANFGRLVKDPYFWGALQNTFIIWTINFIPQLGIALILAIWLSDSRLNLTGKGLFRAVIYMPNLLTAASIALLYRSIFGASGHVNAPANQFLRSIGVYYVHEQNGEMINDAFNFFRSVPFARSLTAFIQWWMWYGHTLIMLMAGITSIPISLYESATVDGANSRQTAWYITLPLLRPMMLYILVTSMIGGMQMFDIPFLLTDMRGSPDYKIRTTVVYQYNIAFQGVNDKSYGAAVSIGIFIVTIVLALIIFFFLQDRSELQKKKGGKA